MSVRFRVKVAHCIMSGAKNLMLVGSALGTGGQGQGTGGNNFFHVWAKRWPSFSCSVHRKKYMHGSSKKSGTWQVTFKQNLHMPLLAEAQAASVVYTSGVVSRDKQRFTMSGGASN